MSAVVVTGIGVVSPLGLGADAFREALSTGRSAIAPIRGFDPGPDGPRLGAEVGDFDARAFLPAEQLRRMDRVSRMIVVAATMAATGADLRTEGTDELGVVVGSALGNMSESAQFLHRVFTKGPALANPMLFPNLVLNAPASQVAIALGWRGPNFTVCEGEISGEVALEAAIGLLRRKRARAVVAAAGDELAAVVHSALRGIGRLSPRGGSREWSSPFDEGANGPILGEGAAALALETAESAAARGARPLAVVESVRRFVLPTSSPHLWPAGGEPLERGAGPDPDLLFSGADSSPERDGLELALLSRFAGLPVYSPKGATGEFGSSGLTGIACAVLSLDGGLLPPLVHFERPRAGFTLSFSKEPTRGSWRQALVLGTARGGCAIEVRLSR